MSRDFINSTFFKEGFKASNYVPIHNMLIMEYQEEDVLLQLILYTPKMSSKDALFAWKLFKIENNQYVYRGTQTAIFDETEYENDQKLPPLKEMGKYFYRKLTTSAHLLS